MQVEVHHVHAKIAGARDAGERVHVRAVHVQQRAVFVQDFGGLGDILLEHAERRRIRDHHGGHVVVHNLFQARDVDLAAFIRGHVFHVVAGNHRGRGIGAVRGVGYQNFFARVSLRVFEVRANEQQAGEFALRARRRFQRARIHARNFDEAILEQLQNFQAALRKFLRLVGMLGGDAVQAGDEFIHARIVFHGAGAERVHAEIDGVIPGGEPREVADHFDLADFGKSFDALAHVIGAQRGPRVHGGHVQRRQLETALAWPGLLEDQPFILADVASRFFDSIGQSKSPFASPKEWVTQLRIVGRGFSRDIKTGGHRALAPDRSGAKALPTAVECRS